MRENIRLNSAAIAPSHVHDPDSSPTIDGSCLSRTQEYQLVGHSREMAAVGQLILRVSRTIHPVLLEGEAGTGMEQIAWVIHERGKAWNKSFIPLQCKSLDPTSLEGELFGYPNRASKKSKRAGEGLLTASDGGTVFLDDVGELPLNLQTRLLRSLQEKGVWTAGMTHPLPITARLICATSSDLSAMVEKGSFRRDLYLRLNAICLRLPALRDRKDDIRTLSESFLAQNQANMIHSFSDEAMELMIAYDWPGNLLELESAIRCGVALCDQEAITIADLPFPMREFASQRRDEIKPPETALGKLHTGLGFGIIPLAQLERNAIFDAIGLTHGDKMLAARFLGLGKTTLYRKLKEYGSTMPVN